MDALVLIKSDHRIFLIDLNSRYSYLLNSLSNEADCVEFVLLGTMFRHFRPSKYKPQLLNVTLEKYPLDVFEKKLYDLEELEVSYCRMFVN